jgi:hypothetical protein
MNAISSYLERKKNQIEAEIHRTPSKVPFQKKYELINDLGLTLIQINNQKRT